MNLFVFTTPTGTPAGSISVDREASGQHIVSLHESGGSAFAALEVPPKQLMSMALALATSLLANGDVAPTEDIREQHKSIDNWLAIGDS